VGLWLCWLGNGFERHAEVAVLYVATLCVNSYCFHALFVQGRVEAAVAVGWAGLVAAAATAGAMARARGGGAAACMVPYVGAVAWLLRFATVVAANDRE
jgi:tryptophan-rich sensory protein